MFVPLIANLIEAAGNQGGEICAYSKRLLGGGGGVSSIGCGSCVGSNKW